MRKILVPFFIWFLLLVPTEGGAEPQAVSTEKLQQHTQLILNELQGFNVGGGGPAGPASISFVGCTVNDTDLTTYSFVAHATGTAGARKTIIGIGARDALTDYSVASMAVGGAAASEIVDSADAGSIPQAALYIIDNPTGTTATIEVTMSEPVQSVTICVWAAYNIISEVAVDTASAFQTAAANLVLSLDVPADGIGVGMSANASSSTSVTWAGMTERSEDVGDGNASSADTATAGTPLTVGADWSGTNDAIGVTASFR